MTVTHTVFPGIELTYYSIHRESYYLETQGKGHSIEIHHCREGRMEQYQENEFFYLTPGDLSIAKKEQKVDHYHFPLSHYHGISIIIDMDITPECFSCFLKDVNVRPKEIVERLCAKENYCVIRSQPYIEHIFSELYAVPEKYQKGYFKVKILELLLVLSSIEPNENNMKSITISRTQRVLAKEVADYLLMHMNQHITVLELSKRFHVSQTYLQNAFKGVYGIPICSYTRILKMQSAALQLIQTDLTVLEIANAFGYENASKFASTFCKIIGETPLQYRKNHRTK